MHCTQPAVMTSPPLAPHMYAKRSPYIHMATPRQISGACAKACVQTCPCHEIVRSLCCSSVRAYVRACVRVWLLVLLHGPHTSLAIALQCEL